MLSLFHEIYQNIKYLNNIVFNIVNQLNAGNKK